jgi:Fe-Mn family superoxide dismutase
LEVAVAQRRRHPKGALSAAIIKDFGTQEKFSATFEKDPLSQFGSEWPWLVFDQSRLAITTTRTADMPPKHDHIALLTVDAWEHAYCIDYHNARAKHTSSVIDHLLNWDFATENHAIALKGQAAERQSARGAVLRRAIGWSP